MEPKIESKQDRLEGNINTETPLLKSKLGKPVQVLFIFLYFILFAIPAVSISVMAGPIGIISSLVLFVVIPIHIINNIYNRKLKTPVTKKPISSLIFEFLGIVLFFSWFLWFVSPFFQK